MRNVVSAEWTKLLPHRGTWLLVWLYPIATIVIMAIALIVSLTNGSTAPGEGNVATAAGWIEQTSIIWRLPSMSLSRYLIGAYIALVFAGEYGWNTWKLVVPHASRWRLIAAKYAVALGLLCLAWTMAAVIAVTMQFIGAAATGEKIPDGVTLGAILSAHGHLIVASLAPLLVTVGYASVAAVLTRSTLAGFLISLVMVTLDEAGNKIVLGLSYYGMEWLSVPYRILPGYHLDNVSGWLNKGVGFELKLASGTVVSYAETTSIMVLAAWIVGLGAATFVAFRRQDIN